MKSKSNPLLHTSRLALVAITFGALPAFAGTLWDGGATPDTNIDTPANWDADTAPSLAGTTGVIFQSTNNIATLNVPAAFRMPSTATPAVAFAANFTLNSSGGNNLTLYGTNSGGNAPVLRSNSTPTAVTVNAPIKVFATSPAVAPLGNLLHIGVNNTSAANNGLTLTGDISLASGSSATIYDIRFYSSGAKAKISGAISGLGTLANSNTSWSGELTIAGDQTSTSTSSINIASGSGFGTPTTTARLVLGESSADDQTWKDITLSNVMNLAIGGNITANVFSGNILNTKITGASTTGNISFNSGTIGANVVLGGPGTNENALSIIKKSSGTLTISSTTATYTGATTVEAGTLNITTASLASSISVSGGATLAGEPTTTGALTFGVGDSILSFNPATPGALTANSVDVSAATAIIMSPTAALTNGTPYLVLKRSTGTFSGGDLAKFILPTRGGSKSLTGGDTEITLTPSAGVGASLVWKGNVSTAWDIVNTQNWTNGGSPDRFYSDDAVTFDDTATTFTVAVALPVTPGNIVFNNTTSNTYTFSGSGIGGAGLITKNGTGLVTLPNALSNTGGIDVNAGTLDLGNSANKTFTGGINIDGGELQFASTIAGSLNAQAVTLAGGTINFKGTATTTNDATQTFNITTNGSQIKTDTSANITWRIGGKVSGAGNFVKSGAGVLSLGTGTSASNNNFTGTLTVTAGTLDIRNGDSLGATSAGTSIQDATLLMQNFGQTAGTIVVNEPLSFSGNSFLTSYCQEVKAFTNEFKGAVTVAAGTTLGLATARTGANTPPTLELNGSTITTGAGSILSFGNRPAVFPASFAASAQTVNVGSAITGPAAVVAAGDAGSVYTLNAPGYGGNTTVNSGKLKLGAVNATNEASTVTIATGAKIDIAFSGNDTVATLILGGTTMLPGTYNATNQPTFFDATSTGSIVVPAASTGYSAWQSANAPGQTVDQDHDNDGVDNGVEYFMGLSGNSFTANPAVAGGAVTWPMGATYSGVYGADYVVQTSSDLDTWDPATVGAGAGFVAITPGVSVTYTLPTGAGKIFVRLLVNPN
jgi:autotransporter-associated beta strand protein